jgi:hypothetical protein
VRIGVLALLLALPAASFADRQFFIPTGDKIRYRDFRLEYFADNSKSHNYLAYAGIGVTKDFEAELMLDKFNSSPSVASFSVAYNFINPITDAVPGISIGVQDVLNKTEFGRMGYLATTFRKSVDSPGLSEHMDVTLGIGVGKKTTPFVGVSLPLGSYLNALAEHDGTRITAGFELVPAKGLALRVAARERRTLFSVRYTARF